jgi:hypothetical protein
MGSVDPWPASCLSSDELAAGLELVGEGHAPSWQYLRPPLNGRENDDQDERGVGRTAQSENCLRSREARIARAFPLSRS